MFKNIKILDVINFTLFVNVIGKLVNQLVWFLYEYIGVYLVEKFNQI